MARAKRKYRIVHESYLIEWLGLTYPVGTWATNVRLGRIREINRVPPITPEEKRFLMPFLASVDAIVLLPDQVHLIEAMVRHEPGIIEDLLKYEELFKVTEEFKPHWEKPIRKIIVSPLAIPWYEEFGKRYDIQFITYRPIWILEYLGTYPRRHRRGQLSHVEPV